MGIFGLPCLSRLTHGGRGAVVVFAGLTDLDGFSCAHWASCGGKGE